MERASTSFYPYRHVRKVTIFGSARTLPAHAIAVNLLVVTQLGFMVMTGGGGGIMQAGNGAARTVIWLNIHLPFEQEANPIMQGDPKLTSRLSSPGSYFFCEKVML